MAAYKVCVYLSDDEEKIVGIDTLKPRGAGEATFPEQLLHELEGFLSPAGSYSAMKAAGWEEYDPSEEGEVHSPSRPDHPHKKYLQKEIEN